MILNIKDKFTNTCEISLFNCEISKVVSVPADTNFQVYSLGIYVKDNKICWEVFFMDDKGSKFLIESLDSEFDAFINSIKISKGAELQIQ